jgi:Fe2+ or Zn2+ uptake regulation protein
MQRKQIRETRQRYAIKRSINELGRPLAPKEILDHASRYVPNLGIATVYRHSLSKHKIPCSKHSHPIRP